MQDDLDQGSIGAPDVPAGTDAGRPTEGTSPLDAAPEGTYAQETEGQAEESGEPTPEQKRRAEAKIQRLIFEKQQERMLRLDLERRVQELESRQPQEPAAPSPGAESVAHPTHDRPQLKDYETVEQWQEADTRWLEQYTDRVFQERESRATEARRRAEIAAERNKVTGTFVAEENSYIESLPPDAAKAYQETAQRVGMFLGDGRGGIHPQAQPLAEALFRAGPKVVQAIGERLDVLEQLVNSDPVTIGMEIGRIKQQVEDKGRQGRRFSAATPPEPLLSAARSSPAAIRYEDLSGMDYMKVRQQEEAERRKARLARPF